MRNIAVILAGGKGTRFGSDIPKQFVKLAGKTIIEHTIDTFQRHNQIDEICIVMHPEWIWKAEEIVNKNNFTKVKKIISGGKERKDSSLSAIEAYSSLDGDVNLIFHDAVRPFVDHKIIDECIQALSHYNAVDVAIPATDTIIEVENRLIEKIPNRDRMMQGQTPQCFKLKTIKKAYEIAVQDKEFRPTDDCGVVKKYLPDEKIYVVTGSQKNIKITHAQDIFLADKIFQLKTTELKHRFSPAYYRQKLAGKVLVVFGGSYGIGKEIVDIAGEYGAHVYAFSRSATNTNVASVSDVREALAHVHKMENRIDFVVNTASILIKEPLQSMSYEDILELVNINYLGAVNIAKESLPFLEESAGQLLNFTSSSYTRGRANYALYSSSKAAIVNLVQALSEEWADKNVRVNCINPERTLTPMRIKNFGKEDPSTLLDARSVAYVSVNTLLSDLTGQIVDVRVDNG
ncbi:MAG: 2-C-methyl-D-erythritol 4-phosphate cytidylyltransferase [Epsilonproteobacteria bacterium]|nr:2-C-methyl-D-erythritol 4-phosphate cytidylyltransferase [Campylobacterota bacterium]